MNDLLAELAVPPDGREDDRGAVRIDPVSALRGE